MIKTPFSLLFLYQPKETPTLQRGLCKPIPVHNALINIVDTPESFKGECVLQSITRHRSMMCPLYPNVLVVGKSGVLSQGSPPTSSLPSRLSLRITLCLSNQLLIERDLRLSLIFFNINWINSFQ